MTKRPLRALTFLAPNMLPVYQFMMDYVGGKLGCAIELDIGTDYAQVDSADLAFICGLPYVMRTQPIADESTLEALAAPVLQGERFQNRPIYFSDVIVGADSDIQSFKDLRGRSWAYNEPLSQSGYGITRYTLATMGETNGFFGKVVASGFHQKSIRMVASGYVDASAIDAQVLAVELREHPELAERVRVINTLGPSTIQPLAAVRHLPDALKQDVRAILAEIHHEPDARAALGRGFIDKIVPVSDADYDDIRTMLTTCQRANFFILK